MKKNVFFLILLLILPFVGYAQFQEKLSTRYQTYTQGNILIIGNNILNRQANKNGANTDYNEILGKSNDDFYMEYIDIDKDKKTFSSSSATLIPPAKKPNILFAGLYWSATYPFEEGQKKGKGFVAKDNQRKNFTDVLLKLPKAKSYTEVSGEVLFDGGMNFNHLNKSPYVAFADITSLMQEAKRIDGVYTVANVTASRGYIEGGSAAGWSIVVVYEDTEEPMQRIEIKDGFVEISKKHNFIHFDKFQTPNSQESVSRITGMVLGADASAGENKLAIYTDKGGVYLETDTRKVTNFFNSSITDGEDYLPKRLVNSYNTLGFDVFSTDVPNFENAIIPQGTTAVDVDITSDKDNFYLCVLGLTIESEENPKTAKNQEEQPLSFLDLEQETSPAQSVSTPKETPKYSTNNNRQPNSKQDISFLEIDDEPSVKTEPVAQPKQAQSAPKKEDVPANVRKVAIKEVQKGFYTILGAYSTPENAERFIQSVKKKGITANKFFYPEKKLYYIYNTHSASYNDALKSQMNFIKSKQNNKDLKTMKDPWIFFIQN